MFTIYIKSQIIHTYELSYLFQWQIAILSETLDKQFRVCFSRRSNHIVSGLGAAACLIVTVEPSLKVKR
jgi:hypothetical protein